MSKKIQMITLLGIITLVQLHWMPHLLAATSGVLAVSVVVAEKCRVDFSEGSADFFQVCSAAPGVSNERSSNVLGATIAVDPAADPYYLDRDPDNPRREAAAGAVLPAAASTVVRRGPKVVNINY